jgi:hypothetical protein
MIHGFDINSPLCCEGVIGDGCGGGRLFYIEDETLKSYDETTQESLLLLENIKDAEKITKDGCLIFIESSTQKRILFDLSLLKIIEE